MPLSLPHRTQAQHRENPKTRPTRHWHSVDEVRAPNNCASLPFIRRYPCMVPLRNGDITPADEQPSHTHTLPTSTCLEQQATWPSADTQTLVSLCCCARLGSQAGKWNQAIKRQDVLSGATRRLATSMAHWPCRPSPGFDPTNHPTRSLLLSKSDHLALDLACTCRRRNHSPGARKGNYWQFRCSHCIPDGWGARMVAGRWDDKFQVQTWW